MIKDFDLLYTLFTSVYLIIFVGKSRHPMFTELLPTSSPAKTGQSENKAFTLNSIPAHYLHIVIVIVLFDIFRYLCADKLATPTVEGIQVP